MACLGCEVMTSISVQTACFGVCLWQVLYNSAGHLSNTQKHRMTIENLILEGQVQTLFSENKTLLTGVKCLLPRIMKRFEGILRI